MAGSGADSHEASIELTYRNAGVDPALDNALVILLRFELSFSKQLTDG